MACARVELAVTHLSACSRAGRAMLATHACRAPRWPTPCFTLSNPSAAAASCAQPSRPVPQGHFYLAELLQPHLAADARIVVVSSGTHDPAVKAPLPQPKFDHPSEVAMLRWGFGGGGEGGGGRASGPKLRHVPRSVGGQHPGGRQSD